MQEPPLASFEAAPECSLDAGPPPVQRRPRKGLPLHRSVRTLSGSLLRVTTCELLYGPFNCGFAWRLDNT